MKIAKKDIEAIIWLLREIIALFLKLKKKNKDEKENEDNEKDYVDAQRAEKQQPTEYQVHAWYETLAGAEEP